MVTGGEVNDPIDSREVGTNTVACTGCERQRKGGRLSARVEESEVNTDAERVRGTRNNTRMTVVSSIRAFDHAAE